MTDENDARERLMQACALGRLSAQEAADLDAQAASDPELRAQLALARAIVRAGATDPERRLPTAFGWARLARAIDAQGTVRQRKSGLPDRFSRWQVAAAVCASVAVWQFAAVPSLSGERGGPGYDMAGSAQPSAFVARVAFRPDATELQIRQALQQAGARVVGGPSALGLYDLAFADRSALQSGVGLLGANKALVEQIQTARPEDAASRPR